MQEEITEGFCLSPQQKRLWLLQQHAADYKAQCAVLLEGSLEVERLERALRKIVKRHEILRTAFDRLPGMRIPFQVVAEDAMPALEQVYLTGLDDSEQGVKIEELFRDERRLASELNGSSPLRLTLLKLQADRHILFISLPSLCADSRALRNLVSEMSILYDAGFRGDALPDEPLQYADFSEWENRRIEPEEEDEGKTFWHKYADASLFNLSLPAERAPLPERRFEPESFTQAVDPEVVEKIEAAADRHGASAPIFLLTCWQTLLWRLTGQAQVVVGMTCDGREYEMLKDAIGLFAKTVPILFHFEGNIQFAEALQQVREISAEAYEQQKYFDMEQVEGAAGDEAEPAFFSAGFEYDERAFKQVAGGLEFSVYRQFCYIEQFKIWLLCSRDQDGLSLQLLYDSLLFSASDISRLMSQLLKLIDSAASDPQRLISDLDLLSDEERRFLLVESNLTRCHYQEQSCLHQLFEQQAMLTPDRIACCSEEHRLSYAQLNARANQLARCLCSKGAGVETLVGICLDRSIEMMVGILAVLKSGAAYLPLDPEQPRQRNEQMLQEGGVRLVLSKQKFADRLADQPVEVICLDADQALFSRENEEDLINKTTLANLAYVIFTSGSTGRPKGVAVEHRQLLNYVRSISERLALPAGGSFTLISTFTADLGNTVIFPSLYVGGCLYIIPEERALNPQALAEYFHRNPIDCLKVVPSHLETLLSLSQPEQLLPRQRLVLGGEACRAELVEQIHAMAPECVIFNHYGPTETTVGVLTFQTDRDRPGHGCPTLPLGRPISNIEIYLLDSRQQLVPIEVPGELLIGGAGLARGYLNRPDHTAERFIPHPFSDEPGARLYKTGDLARYFPDGNIEFLGRIDHQVKIRGYRIELGEIEAALFRHPMVRKAVVNVRDHASVGKSLVAYLVASQKPGPAASELRSFLKDKLPDYMIPAYFVVLDSLPLTSNGKIDRRALPDPTHLQPTSEAPYAAPRSELERIIADLWQSALQVEKVGVYDSFFDLGGHSLLMIQVHGKLQESTGQEFSIIDMFKHPTVNSLANYLGRHGGPQTFPLHDQGDKVREGKKRSQKRLKQSQQAVK